MGEISNEDLLGIGFTGTKLGVSHAQHRSLFYLLSDLYLPGRWLHHGDCKGSDVQAAYLAKGLGYRISCHPPINPRHRGWFRQNDIVNPEYDYIVRDQHIVNDSRILIATPHTPYEIIRSGTWTTVRYAREKGRTIYVIKPDGTIETN